MAAKTQHPEQGDDKQRGQRTAGGTRKLGHHQAQDKRPREADVNWRAALIQPTAAAVAAPARDLRATVAAEIGPARIVPRTGRLKKGDGRANIWPRRPESSVMPDSQVARSGGAMTASTVGGSRPPNTMFDEAAGHLGRAEKRRDQNAGRAEPERGQGAAPCAAGRPTGRSRQRRSHTSSNRKAAVRRVGSTGRSSEAGIFSIGVCGRGNGPVEMHQPEVDRQADEQVERGKDEIDPRARKARHGARSSGARTRSRAKPAISVRCVMLRDCAGYRRAGRSPTKAVAFRATKQAASSMPTSAALKVAALGAQGGGHQRKGGGGRAEGHQRAPRRSGRRRRAPAVGASRLPTNSATRVHQRPMFRARPKSAANSRHQDGEAVIERAVTDDLGQAERPDGCQPGHVFNHGGNRPAAEHCTQSAPDLRHAAFCASIRRPGIRAETSCPA